MRSIESAFEEALREVARAERRLQRTRDGQLATRELASLRAGLEAARERARASGAIDRAEIGALVREVSAWYPEGKIHLIAALGALTRAE